jgi:DivIVA domain-containing protein
MAWLFGILVVLVLGGIAAVAAGRGGQMPEDDRDLAPSRVPEDGPLTTQHLRAVRFPLALRGYRMSDVDALLSRLATQLEADARPTEQEQETDRSTARSERPDAT